MFRRGRPQEQSTAAGQPEIPASSEPLDEEALADERLMRKAQSGDLPSFNALVVRHERPVYAVCLRMLRDVQAAEDATQDTFLKAWTSIDTFRGGLVRPWLLKIASNRCLDILRARSRRPADSLDAEIFESEPQWTSQTSASEDPEVFATRTELSTVLERVLGALPEDQRLVIVLSDVHGHSYEEIAEIAGIAVGTVKSRISRARSRLRDALREEPGAGELLDRFVRLSGDASDEQRHARTDESS